MCGALPLRRRASSLSWPFRASSFALMKLPSISVDRRAVVSSVVTPLLVAIGITSSAPALPANAASPVREGMSAFSSGDVEQSIQIFDSVIASQPSSKPYLWQRGLSLYYADRFADGAEQFATDVSVNPNDTEESIWNFMCVSRLDGFEAARAKMLKVGQDRRPVMRASMALFRGETDEAALQALANGASRSASDVFYSNLYLGLYREAQGDADGARRFISTAAKSQYGQKSGDYMADLAKVHLKVRGW